MNIPVLEHPQSYVGLFLYNFGDRVGVGFTGVEIEMLRDSDEFSSGEAYQIYRVDENNRMELRGVSDGRLCGLEAFCFLRQHGEAAMRDYETLRTAAAAAPPNGKVQLVLGRYPGFSPPDATALLYESYWSGAIGQWLSEIDFSGGDDVLYGLEAYVQMQNATGLRIRECTLPSPLNYQDRKWSEVLEAIDRPVQR